MNGVDEFLCHKASLVKTKMMLQTHPHSHLCLLSNFSHVLLCATLYSRMAGSSVDGILQARILEWIAISYSLGFSGPRDLTHILATPALAGGFLTSSATWEAPLSSDQSLSPVWLFETEWTAAFQASLFITKSRACSNSCPSSQGCHSTFSSSVIPFFSNLQSFPAWGSLTVSQFFASSGQSIGVSSSASVLPVNIQDWFPLGLTGLMHGDMQSNRLSRDFSDTTVQQHLNFLALSFLYGTTLTSIHDCWKNHNLD